MGKSAKLGNQRGGGLVAKLCPALGNSWTVTCQAPLSMGFPRQDYWSGLPFSSPGDLPNPGTELQSPTLEADSLPTELPGNSLQRGRQSLYNCL